MSPKPDDWKDEAYQAYVAKWRAHEAAESERRRQEGKIAIWLERGPDDSETFTKEHQLALHTVVDVLRDQGVNVEAPFTTLDSADAVGGYTGQLIVPLIQAASPFLTAAVVAWVKGRSGRKIRAEFYPGGQIKSIEAQTEEQVLSIAEAFDHEARTKSSKAEPK